MTVYKRTDEATGLTYFTNRAKYASIRLTREQRRGLTADEQAVALETAIRAHFGVATDSLDSLREATGVVARLNKLLKPTQDSRRELALQLLRDGEDPHVVHDACGVSWHVLRSWCTSSSRHEERAVPREVLDYIDAQVDAVFMRNRAAAIKAHKR